MIYCRNRGFSVSLDLLSMIYLKVLQDLRKSTFKTPYVGANGIISVPDEITFSWNTKWSSDEIMRMKWRKFYDVNKKFTNLFLESFIDVLFVEEVNFKDNYTCSYKGCEGGNFFFEIFKFKKSRSPPN